MSSNKITVDEEFFGRLKQIMDKAGVNQSGFAKDIGISAGFVSDLKVGRGNLSRIVFEKICRIYSVNENWLLTGAGPMNAPSPSESHLPGSLPVITWDTPEDLPNDQYVFVPRFDIRVSAGNGCTVESELVKDQPQAFRTEWVRQRRLSHDLACVTAHGDSMEPTISNGDTMLVDRGCKEVTDGKVYVIRYGDEIRVKRLTKRYDGAIIVRSDNREKYPEEIIPPEAMNGQVEIVGMVVWKAGEM